MTQGKVKGFSNFLVGLHIGYGTGSKIAFILCLINLALQKHKWSDMAMMLIRGLISP